jgi:uncharacterized protein (TIGR01777 family)
MHILMTGGTGFIGGALCQKLLGEGHQLTLLTRQSLVDTQRCRYIASLEDIDPQERFEAVINLAGASLAERRWTAAYKAEILASRLETTRALLQLMQRLENTPEILLSASAIGYYGHHGDEELDESGSATPGFAQDLCQQWEQLALTVRELGVRVCLLRLGVVLDSGGGAFSQMARPFSFGVANWLGSGEQWLSWVHREDVVRAIQFLLQHSDLEGPFNITAPVAVTSRGFCDAMKRHKRTLLTAPVPAAVMRLMVGEMAEELLLNGQRVVPAALQQAGFSFNYPGLDVALRDIL